MQNKDKKNKLGLTYDAEGENMVASQLRDSYQSGYIDENAQREREQLKGIKPR
ncbi:hypothetical protein IMZ31_14255 [Pontibacillus sp. ALD_SL1]|uniref:hypothetical protein n=1 Tax=Pontibacillus TaxID=289201 RepID=UPI000AF3B952|nr:MULTISPECIES: hypothetical protein [Pontibacillus]QSS99238.1 hypothetical protein IMZ31_14255 [Pontibacillus sp. ALD_SL1]